MTVVASDVHGGESLWSIAYKREQHVINVFLNEVSDTRQHEDGSTIIDASYSDEESTEIPSYVLR